MATFHRSNRQTGQPTGQIDNSAQAVSSFHLLDAICEVLETVPTSELPPQLRRLHICLAEHLVDEAPSEVRLSKNLTQLLQTVRQRQAHMHVTSTRWAQTTRTPHVQRRSRPVGAEQANWGLS